MESAETFCIDSGSFWELCGKSAMPLPDPKGRIRTGIILDGRPREPYRAIAPGKAGKGQAKPAKDRHNP